MSQEVSELNLKKASEQLGIKLPGQPAQPHEQSTDKDDRFDAGDSASSLYGLETQSAVVVDHEDDSLAPEKKPLVKIIAILAILLPTLGLGLMVLLWSAGEMQSAKTKPTTLPAAEKESVASAQEKEIADLKTKMLMQQQKADTAAAIANPAASSTMTGGTPTNSVTTVPGATATLPVVAKTPTSVKPTANPTVTTTPVVTNESNTARQQALIEQRQQAIQRATARDALQKEILQVNSARQARASESSRLAGLRKEVQDTTARLKSLNTRVANNRTARGIPATPRIAVANKGFQQVYGGNSSNTFNQQPKTRATWDEVASLSIYGGQNTENKVAEAPQSIFTPVSDTRKATDSAPTMRLPAGAVVPGRLLTPFYTLISQGQNQQPLSQITKNTATVVIDRAIDVGTGYSLPVGTTIEFELSVADNGMVQAVSKNVIFKNTQIDIPAGAFSITGTNNRPLIATIDSLNNGRIQSAKNNSAIFGVLSSVGKALLQGSTNSTVTIGNGTTIAQSNNGSPNILGAVLSGFSNSVLEGNAEEARALTEQLKNESKVAYLMPGTTLNIYVNQGVTFPLPLF